MRTWKLSKRIWPGGRLATSYLQVCLLGASVCRLVGMQEQLRGLLDLLQGRVADLLVRHQLRSWRVLARILHGEPEWSRLEWGVRSEQVVLRRTPQQAYRE